MILYYGMSIFNAAIISAGIPLISTQSNAVRGSGKGWMR